MVGGYVIITIAYFITQHSSKSNDNDSRSADLRESTLGVWHLGKHITLFAAFFPLERMFIERVLS